MHAPEMGEAAATGVARGSQRKDGQPAKATLPTTTAAPHRARRTPKLADPVIVSEFWATRNGQSVRVQLRDFEGRTLVDARRYFTNKDGVLQPTKKGISLAVTRLPDLAAAINKALRTAIDLGLIKSEAGNDE
jgi:hypothetical protein